MNKMLGALLVFSLLFALSLGTALAEEPAAPKIFNVGDKVEGLSATDSAGNKVDLVKALGGKDKGIIVFMNTACSACLLELQMVNAIYKEHSMNVEMVVVSVDFGGFDKVAAYKDSNRFSGTWLQDRDFAVPEAFGFAYTPALTVIDKSGKVLFKKAGYTKRQAKQLKSSIEGVL